MRSDIILPENELPVNIDFWEEDGAADMLAVEAMEEVAEQLARWQVNRRDYCVDPWF